MLVAALALAIVPAAAHAQQQVAMIGSMHTATVTVTLGKTQDVRTDQNLTDITVGDPDIADVSPLTDHALSILGKKIGTTRVTAYGPDKKPVGIFDVEVSYDFSRLAVEIARFTGGGINVSSVNGRIMLSGTSPGRGHAGQGSADRAPVRSRSDQHGPGDAAAADQLEVRFIEVDRNASRDLGVQWNMFGNSALANVGSGLPASQLPITQPNGAFQQPGCRHRGRRRQRAGQQSPPLSPVVAAGVLSGAAPFGFLVGQLSNRLQVAVNALETKGAARSLAEPNLVALSGETASFLAGGEFPVPEVGATGTPLIRLPALRRRPLLHADRAQGRPHQSGDQAGSERDRHQPYR